MNNQSSKSEVVHNTSQEDADTINIGQIISSLYSGIWLIIFISLFAFIFSVIYASNLDSRFRSSTKIYIDGASSADVAMPGFSGFDMSTPDDRVLNSEIEIIRSSSIISRVADNLNLYEDPEFNTALKEPSRLSRNLSNIIEFFIGPPQQPSQDERENRERQAVNEKILSDLQVRIVRDTFVLEISFAALSPQRAKEIVQEFAQTYIHSRSATKAASTEKSLKLLQTRLPKLRDDVVRLENQLIGFEADGGVITQQSLAVANSQLAEQIEQISKLTERNDVITATLGQYSNTAITTDDAFAILAALAPATSSRQVRDIDAVNRARLELRSAIEWKEKYFQRDLDRLEATSLALRDRIETQSTRQSKYVSLQQELSISNEIYQSYLVRLREVSLEAASIDSDVRVIQEADAPTRHFAPRRSLIVMASILLGIFLGTGCALAYAFFLAPFRKSSEIFQAIGKKVFTLVPDIRGGIDVKSILNQQFNRKTELQLAAAMQDAASLLRSTIEPTPKVISLTSTVPGEGKTTTSLMLAQSLSSAGEKVLLVDADLHRATLSKELAGATGAGFKIGLSQILEGATELNKGVLHELNYNYDFLCAGAQPQASSRLLYSRKFLKLVEQFSNTYDVVIFDCPPVTANSDPIIISKASDLSLYVMRAGKTSKNNVVRNIQRFEERLSEPVEILFCGKAGSDQYNYSYGSEPNGAYA